MCMLGRNSMQIRITFKFVFSFSNCIILKLGCYMFDNIQNHTKVPIKFKMNLNHSKGPRPTHEIWSVKRGLTWFGLANISQYKNFKFAMEWNLIKQRVGWSMSYDQMKAAWGNKLGEIFLQPEQSNLKFKVTITVPPEANKTYVVFNEMLCQFWYFYYCRFWKLSHHFFFFFRFWAFLQRLAIGSHILTILFS